MATIDPNIAMGYKPIQVENPLNQLAAVTQIQSGLQGQQMNALKMKETERELGENEQIRNYLVSADLKTPEGRAGLRRFGKTGLAYEKLIADQEKADLERKELGGKISKQDTDRNNQRLRDLSRNPSDANIQAHFEDFMIENPNDARKIEDAQRRRDYLLSADMPTRNAYLSSIGATASDLKTTVKDRDIGGSIIPTVLDPYSGLPISTGKPIAKIATPGELMTDARARERLKLDQDKILREQTMGAIPAGYRLNKETNELEAIPGGPTTVPLAPKDKQKREAVYPKATSALKAFDDTSNSLIKDLAELRDHPGLSSITGIVAGRLPGATKDGREAQALYDKIVARGGFQALTDLKAAGGTLGAVSNQEGTQLKDSWAAINRTQDASSVKKALDQALATVQTSKDRIRDEYDLTYEYRNTVPRSSTASSAAPAAPSPATVNIKSNAEYDALPSGTIFVDPNGQQRRKP